MTEEAPDVLNTEKQQLMFKKGSYIANATSEKENVEKSNDAVKQSVMDIAGGHYDDELDAKSLLEKQGWDDPKNDPTNIDFKSGQAALVKPKPATRASVYQPDNYGSELLDFGGSNVTTDDSADPEPEP